MAWGLLLACIAIIAVNLVTETDHEAIRVSKVRCCLPPSFPLFSTLLGTEPRAEPRSDPELCQLALLLLQEMPDSVSQETETAWLSSAFGTKNRDSDDTLVDEVSHSSSAPLIFSSVLLAQI